MAAKAARLASFVAWRGPSQITGDPIMAVAVMGSSNRKTGPMAQIHILTEAVHPVEAVHSGADAAICGDCPLRGDHGRERGCYVRLQGEASAWRASRSRPMLPRDEVLARLAGKQVRLGAYGDPAALPLDVIESWCAVAASWTGYTHQWRALGVVWSYLLMASVGSEDERDEAHSFGWRTFRVGTTAPNHREIVCPNVTRGVQCQDCRLCDGARRPGVRSIVIAPHGSGAKYVKEAVHA